MSKTGKSKVDKKKSFKSKSAYSSMRFTIINSGEHVTILQDQCKKSYAESRRMYKQFFSQCLEEIEALQPNGFSCIQVNRYFIIGVLQRHCTVPDPLTKKQRQRVERILAE